MNLTKNKLIALLIFSTLPLFSAHEPIDEFLYENLLKNTGEACRKVFVTALVKREIGSYLDPEEIKDNFKIALGSDYNSRSYDYAKMKEAVALALLYKQLNHSKDSLMIDLSRLSTYRTTWFTAAMQEKDLQIVTLFLDHGFDMHVCDGFNGRTAFMTACAHGAEDIALAFIKYGVDVNSRYNHLNNSRMEHSDIEKEVPLFLAATYSGGSYIISKALIDRGADMYARVSDQTVLHRLVSRRLDDSGVRILQFFLDRNFDLTLQDRKGNTVVHQAVSYLGSPLKILLEYNSGLSCLAIVNKCGETPLHVAACQFQPEHVKLLIASGADGSIKDFYGDTPLQAVGKTSTKKSYQISVDKENKEAVVMLLKAFQAKKR